MGLPSGFQEHGTASRGGNIRYTASIKGEQVPANSFILALPRNYDGIFASSRRTSSGAYDFSLQELPWRKCKSNGKQQAALATTWNSRRLRSSP